MLKLIAVLLVCLSAALSSKKVEVISEEKFDLGEGPFWDEKTNTLFHVDINNGDVCRTDPATKKTERYHLGDLVDLVIPYKNGDDLLVGRRNTVVKLNWKTKQHQLIATVAKDLNGRERFNDGKIDDKGRLWIGTLLDGGNF